MRPKTKGRKGARRRSAIKEKKGEKKAWATEDKIQSWVRSSRLPLEVQEKVFKFAASGLPVFIQGEEGTGRDEVAQALHSLSPWKHSPFLRFSCRLLSPEKFVQRISPWLRDKGRKGKISLILYLEDLESLEGEMQAFLLDLLKNQRISWPGLAERSLDVRVISSSTNSLAQAVAAKRFRGDLFEILETVSVALKPLRERREDIPRMAGEILREKEVDGRPPKRFSPEALKALQQYEWPGNLQELESLVLRSATLKEGELLQPGDLIFHSPGGPLKAAEIQTEEREFFFDLTLPTLAHEIKNPLVAISTFAHLLPEKYEDAEFRQDFSRLVNQDVKRINELLENLLEFTQFSPPHPAPNDLNFILIGVIKQKEKAVHRWGGKITTELSAGLPLILFDETQLGFVLRNLLENALSKMSPDVPLRIATSFSWDEGTGGRQEFVDLRVWYDGPEEFPGTIQRAGDRETEPDFRNLSLALLLVRKVMARNRGTMQVRQEGEEGMTVRLRFPVVR